MAVDGVGDQMEKVAGGIVELLSHNRVDDPVDCASFSISGFSESIKIGHVSNKSDIPLEIMTPTLDVTGVGSNLGRMENGMAVSEHLPKKIEII